MRANQSESVDCVTNAGGDLVLRFVATGEIFAELA
jgi:hypothetical protein